MNVPADVRREIAYARIQAEAAFPLGTDYQPSLLADRVGLQLYSFRLFASDFTCHL